VIRAAYNRNYFRGNKTIWNHHDYYIGQSVSL